MTKEYYDIVLFGKTGKGKSTLGNKLLNANSESENRFTVAGDRNPAERMFSVTEVCKLMANDDSNVRVLDVPGFSDSSTFKKHASVHEGNSVIVRGVVRSQMESNLKVRRIVYFLPVRGALTIADATMQEELKVLYQFGKKVFECMVVVATIAEEYQQHGCSDSILQTNIKIFTAALKHAVSEDIACLPIVYIGLHASNSECLSKIKEARVVKDAIFLFDEHVGARCAVKRMCSIKHQNSAATDKSGGKKVSDPVYVRTKEYYDIVIVGKTLQGKSTLGNKLLDVNYTNPSKIRLFSRDNSERRKKRFTVAGDYKLDEQIFSVTEVCKLMANDDSNIRVLDVPGFSDSNALRTGTEHNISVYEGNLGIVRGLVREQIVSNLKVRRIVYFLPSRGPLEKADGIMQAELKVLHYFFGKKVFECMVVVATNPKAFQAYGCSDSILQINIKIFTAALKLAIPEYIPCPPIVYIGLDDSNKESLSKIKQARVVNDEILPLKFSEDICARCAIKIVLNVEKQKVSIIHTDGTTAPYADSKCHPRFVTKYTRAQKIFGGVAHMATLGIGLLVEKLLDKDSWPGFTNSDEICVLCKKSPGSDGCVPVGTTITIEKDKHITVNHTNELDV